MKRVSTVMLGLMSVSFMGCNLNEDGYFEKAAQIAPMSHHTAGELPKGYDDQDLHETIRNMTPPGADLCMDIISLAECQSSEGCQPLYDEKEPNEFELCVPRVAGPGEEPGSQTTPENSSMPEQDPALVSQPSPSQPVSSPEAPSSSESVPEAPRSSQPAAPAVIVAQPAPGSGPESPSVSQPSAPAVVSQPSGVVIPPGRQSLPGSCSDLPVNSPYLQHRGKALLVFFCKPLGANKWLYTHAACEGFSNGHQPQGAYLGQCEK
jgi:hypothetical protein